MLRRFSWIAVGFFVAWQLACGSGPARQSPESGSSVPPGTQSADISISPATTPVGSPDLTLTITGSQDFIFVNGTHRLTQVFWSSGTGLATPLATTFVSSSQLTVTVPAALLAIPQAATVHVEILDPQGDAPIATSSSVFFQVTSSPTPTPTISSMSPLTVAAGSGDLTIMIEGSNFGHYGHFVWSTAFWTTNGNLHDTGTWLQTTIMSDSQIVAVIPEKLLQSPRSAKIVVMNGDVMGMSDGYFGYPRSNSVIFTVTP